MAAITRRKWIARTTAAAGVALLGARWSRAIAQKAERLNFRLAWVAEGIDAPFHLAQERGWYAERGLDVNIDDGNGSVTTIQMIGSDQIDVGEANQSVMALSREKGLRLKSIAGLVRGNDLAAIVPVDSNIASPKDLEGKTCVYTAGSLEAPFLKTFFAYGGVDQAKVRMVAVDAAAKLSMYVTGQADCVFSSTAAFGPLVRDKRPSENLLFSDLGLMLPSMGLIASEETIKTRGEALRSFVQVTLRAWKYVMEEGHEKDGVEAVIRARPQAKLDLAANIDQLEAYKPFLYTAATKGTPLGWQAEADWQSTVKAMTSAELIKPGSKPSDYYTNEFLAR